MIDKLLSGRLFLTICVGVAFVYLCMTGGLEANVISLIIVMVAKDYFSNGKHETREKELEAEIERLKKEIENLRNNSRMKQ